MQTTPLLAGLGVAASALVAQRAATAYAAWRAAPLAMRRFYEGGFEASMSRREAALILGVRQSATEEKVKSAHKKIMIANHPDSGGSDYLAAKINEAKDMMLGKKSETCVGAPPASGPVETDAAPPGGAGSSDFCPGVPCGAPCPLPLMPANFRFPPPPGAGFPPDRDLVRPARRRKPSLPCSGAQGVGGQRCWRGSLGGGQSKIEGASIGSQTL